MRYAEIGSNKAFKKLYGGATMNSATQLKALIRNLSKDKSVNAQIILRSRLNKQIIKLIILTFLCGMFISCKAENNSVSPSLITTEATPAANKNADKNSESPNNSNTPPLTDPTTSPTENNAFVPSSTFSPNNNIKFSKPSFSLNQTSVYPGDTIAVFVSGLNKGGFTVNAPFYDKTINFYPYNKGYVGFIPIYAWLTPATYQIKAYVNGSDLIKTFDIEVLPKKFDVQHLIVDESTATILTNDNAAKDQVYFDRARSNPIQKKLWESAFIQPVAGTITTDYCSTRYTNNNSTPSRHLAIDIANDLGTPIKASNNGKVVLAKKLITTGNTIVIDHGMDIFTSYFHMSELLVKEGDFVSKRDVIGKMGSTGYSTGSHLHFAIWMDGTFLNPWTFFSKDPIDFK